jgi:hypothetical protein
LDSYFADQYYSLVNYTIPATSTLVLNLTDGSLTNQLNEILGDAEAFDVVRFYGFRHELASLSEAVQVGGNYGTPIKTSFAGLLTSVHDSRTVRPNQAFVELSPTVGGMPIHTDDTFVEETAPSQPVIVVHNLDLHHAAIISLYVCGQKVGD